VSDATLTSLVAEVRGALGETAARSRFVRTVHRFGYAFKGTATELDAQSELPVDREACWIVWEWGQVRLAEGQHLLGRDGQVAVWLESPTVSRQHARIRITSHAAMIEDLGSTNGTYVRDQRIAEPWLLVDGDEIRLGSMLVTFRRPSAGHATVPCD
jgi:hypothetical protein